MKIVRVGRMAFWQRWTTHVVLLVCAITGVGYFVGQELLDLQPSANRYWWIAHGATGFVAILVIGGAITQHVVVAWRARRGRNTGTFNLVLLSSLVVTTMILFYGLEPWRLPAHWVHIGAGLVAIVAFPAHVLWGRTRKARLKSFR
jgi:hypothetical protein